MSKQIKGYTGGYPAILTISNQAWSQIVGLRNGESVKLNDPKYATASRCGELVFIFENNGRSYDVYI